MAVPRSALNPSTGPQRQPSAARNQVHLGHSALLHRPLHGCPLPCHSLFHSGAHSEPGPFPFTCASSAIGSCGPSVAATGVDQDARRVSADSAEIRPPPLPTREEPSKLSLLGQNKPRTGRPPPGARDEGASGRAGHPGRHGAWKARPGCPRCSSAGGAPGARPPARPPGVRTPNRGGLSPGLTTPEVPPEVPLSRGRSRR